MGVSDNSEHDIPVIYANKAITKLAVPYTSHLDELKYGQVIIIDGKTPQKSNRFTISLELNPHEGQSEEVKVILNIDVQFDKKRVVRNAKIDGKWGAEDAFGGMGSLRPGHHFECEILVMESLYKIGFNRHHLFDFRHRSPVSSINQLHISGSVELKCLSMQSPPGQKLIRMPHLPATYQDQEEYVEGPVAMYRPKMPLNLPLMSGLKPGCMFYISGKNSRHSKGLTINFKVGHSANEGTIAFHFRVIMSSKTILCNSFLKGSWGKEDPKMENMGNSFPFPPGQHFDLMILVDHNAFKVAVNNIHLLDFKHRVSELSSVQGLQIVGDVNVLHLRTN